MCAFGRMVTDDERLLLRAERLRHSLAQHPVSTTTCRATAQVEFVMARLVSVVNQLKDCEGDTGDAFAWSEDGSQHFRDRLSMTIGGLLGEEEVTVYDVPEVRGKGTVEWVLVLTSWK